MADWMSYFSNARGNYIQKCIFEILKDRYSKHQNISERISVSLLTENDTKEFLSLLIDTYEIGYLKAVDDHKQQLEKLGFFIFLLLEIN